MTWARQWSHKVDGVELNGGGPSSFYTRVPQVNDIPDYDVKSVPIDGTWPAFIRADPTSGVYTFLIDMGPCSEADFDAKLTALTSLFSPAVHTYAFQVRGMAAAKSVLIVPRGRVVQFTERAVAYNCYVPKPVPA